jgi:hypothetical protein
MPSFTKALLHLAHLPGALLTAPQPGQMYLAGAAAVALVPVDVVPAAVWANMAEAINPTQAITNSNFFIVVIFLSGY